jgi:molybdopterin molybdotransferase
MSAHAEDHCCSDGPGRPRLLSVEEARAAILEAARPVEAAPQWVGCHLALGRVLAEDIRAPIDVPPHENSAMDGYALRLGDLGADRRLQISQRIAAGEPPRPLALGTAARIFTGAPLPPGADTVVMQEDCTVEGDWLQIRELPRRGSHIRPQGNDIARGSLVLPAGTRMDPRHLGLLASLGLARVAVRPLTRIALMTTGTELAAPGAPLAPGQIYNSNGPLLTALLQGQACEVANRGVVLDSLAATRTALSEAAKAADLVITTGGVSVGEEDHVKAAVESLGSLDLWRVRMKPGKPLAFGRLGDAHFIGLPGNPVSAYVTTLLFVLPLLRRLQGRVGPVFPDCDYARLGRDWPEPRSRREFLRVRLNREAGDLPWAQAYERQGSDVLTGAAWADGLIEIPENTTPERGTALRYWSFERLLS